MYLFETLRRQTAAETQLTYGNINDIRDTDTIGTHEHLCYMGGIE